jgi:hypothetical protein
MTENRRPDSFILEYSVFGDDSGEIKKRFIKSTGVPFLSDEKVKDLMSETLEKMKIYNDNLKILVKDWKVPERVKVPDEFRQSIFNTCFCTHQKGEKTG